MIGYQVVIAVTANNNEHKTVSNQHKVTGFMLIY